MYNQPKPKPTIYAFTIEDISFFVSIYSRINEEGVYVVSPNTELNTKIVAGDFEYETKLKNTEDCRRQDVEGWFFLQKLIGLKTMYEFAPLYIKSFDLQISFLPDIRFNIFKDSVWKLKINIGNSKEEDKALFSIERSITANSLNQFMKIINQMNKEFNYLGTSYTPFDLETGILNKK